MMDGMGLIEQAEALQSMLAKQKEALTHLSRGNDNNAGRLADARDRLLLLHSQMQAACNDFERALISQPRQHYGQDRWQRFANLSKQCRALSADCFAFDQTIRFRNGENRSHPLHSSAAVDVLIACDSMIEELSRKSGKPRTSYVLLSESAYFQPEISAIHLSYSALSIWNLNQNVHEFGHQWAEEYANGDQGPQRSFLENVSATWDRPVARELFADIVATFLAGPAYAYSCLLLDFNPINRKSSATHPSHDERAHCILTVLDELAKDMPPLNRGRMKGLFSELGRFWSEAREAAGAAGSPATLGTLKAEVPITLLQLKQEIPGAGFTDAESAFRCKVALNSDQPLRGSADIISILNGAWFARLETESRNLKDLQRAVMKMLLPAGRNIEQAS